MKKFDDEETQNKHRFDIGYNQTTKYSVESTDSVQGKHLVRLSRHHYLHKIRIARYSNLNTLK
ncbi:hypothetical protein J6590_037224 [Homalodisca vitripennis]|nr:hypothetical protein J6590_037224 [Homalodisca vitripennis]